METPLSVLGRCGCRPELTGRPGRCNLRFRPGVTAFFYAVIISVARRTDTLDLHLRIVMLHVLSLSMHGSQAENSS